MLLSFLVDVFIFIFGLCIGSFLNAVIYRLEQGKKLTGRSFCPECKKEIPWYDLIPLISFFILGGKCRNCSQKISLQYPLIEVSTGLIFLIIYSLKFQILKQLGVVDFINIAFLFYTASALIVLFVYDFKHYLLPDRILLPAIIIALGYNLVSFYNSPLLLYYFLAGLVAGGFFLFIFLISKGNWMGFGDVKLAFLMGTLLGLKGILVALFLAFFLGAIIGVILMGLAKKNLRSEIPFGPFLIIGTFIALFWSGQIVNWYLSLLNI